MKRCRTSVAKSRILFPGTLWPLWDSENTKGRCHPGAQCHASLFLYPVSRSALSFSTGSLLSRSVSHAYRRAPAQPFACHARAKSSKQTRPRKLVSCVGESILEPALISPPRTITELRAPGQPSIIDNTIARGTSIQLTVAACIPTQWQHSPRIEIYLRAVEYTSTRGRRGKELL